MFRIFRTFQITYALKNTYRVNGILYSIKQIPLIKRIMPVRIYEIRGFKLFAAVLSGLWEIVSAFLGKMIYLLVMVFGIGMVYEGIPQNQLFLHIFFLLTIIGAFTNTYLFQPGKEMYYAVSLMRMNARDYMQSFLGYKMLRLIVGFLPFTILFGRICGVPLMICLLLPFFAAGGKLIFICIFLKLYEKTGKAPDESKWNRVSWLPVVLLLAAAYGLPAMGIVIPVPVITVIITVVTAVGILCIRQAAAFAYYRQLCQKLTAEILTSMDTNVTSQRIVEEINHKKISHDTSIISNKKGLEYFHELFVKRHKKILWNSSKRITAVCLILLAGVTGLCLWRTEASKMINEGLLKILPVFLFVMYLLNRGTTYTQALFINCDHSMLTYAFYKKPRLILKLFWIRLRELIKINLPPALVIGGGLAWLLWVSGGTGQWIHYAVLFITVISMSVFFSVHYLTLYYLLQPYTADTQIKSGMYQVIAWVTYFFCYVMMQVRMSSLIFGAVMIAFTILYCVAAGILVYRLAGKTFRIRNS